MAIDNKEHPSKELKEYFLDRKQRLQFYDNISAKTSNGK